MAEVYAPGDLANTGRRDDGGMDVIEKEFEDRALLQGVQGKRVAWMAEDGAIEQTTLVVDILEVPRAPAALLNGFDLEYAAQLLAVEFKMDVGMLVRWPSGEWKGQWFPSSVGIILLEPGV